jgi:SAM-dependent methyltransferase
MGSRARTTRGRLGALAGRLLAAADRRAFPHTDSPDEHWLRIAMNRAIARHLESLDPASRTAVEISGTAHAGRPWKAYETLAYPEFDLCAPLAEQKRYDVVICEQVLEHVVDPWTAVANLRGLCEPGGHVVVSTPFLVRVHELPEYAMRDYWRFTPRGLRVLLEGSGLEVEKVGSWGNRACVVGNFNRWSAYRSWLPLRNERDFPLQVWGFAINPTHPERESQ